jgi:hypothetical protein
MRLGFWGYEWKSEATLFGLPLVHVAFGWDLETGRFRIARGIIAIGQVAVGLITIAQFGVGLFCGIGQFVFGGFVLAQFAVGVVIAIGQFAVGIYAAGQFAAGLHVPPAFRLW